MLQRREEEKAGLEGGVDYLEGGMSCRQRRLQIQRSCSCSTCSKESAVAGNAGSIHSGGTSGKEPTCQYRRCKGQGFDPWVGKIPWRRKWQPTPVFSPGESVGQSSLVGYNP